MKQLKKERKSFLNLKQTGVKIEIITPEQKVYEGDIRSLKVPGKKGAFQVLKDHAAIVSTLVEGKVTVTDMNGRDSEFEIEGGVIEVLKNKIILLAESVSRDDKQ